MLFVTFVVENFSQQGASRSAQRRGERGEKNFAKMRSSSDLHCKSAKARRRNWPRRSGSPNGEPWSEIHSCFFFFASPRLCSAIPKSFAFLAKFLRYQISRRERGGRAVKKRKKVFSADSARVQGFQAWLRLAAFPGMKS